MVLNGTNTLSGHTEKPGWPLTGCEWRLWGTEEENTKPLFQLQFRVGVLPVTVTFVSTTDGSSREVGRKLDVKYKRNCDGERIRN